MNENDLHDTLTAAYSDVVLPDPAEAVLRRGNHLRRARKLSRTAYVSVAGLAAVALGVSVTTTSPDGSGPIRLVAYSLPSLPVSLDPVPDGLAVSFDYDMGRLIAMYVDAANQAEQVSPDLSLRVLDRAAEDSDATSDKRVSVQGQPGLLYVRDLPGQANDRSTVTWENRAGSWVSLAGTGRFAAEDALLAQAENVTNEALPLNMSLDFAPAGWDLVGYKVIRPGGAVLALSDSAASDADARRLTVALYTGTYEPLVAARMEDPGPVTPIDVQGRVGQLMEGARGSFLQVPFDDGTYITMQAPTDLTRDQVIQMASGVSRN
jgi:hypothetical protein